MSSPPNTTLIDTISKSRSAVNDSFNRFSYLKKTSSSSSPSSSSPSSSSPSSSSSSSSPSSSRNHAPAPPPPRSFSSVIDQDHAQINTLSIQFGKLLSPKLPQTPELRRQRLTQLHTLAWRLVRHDLSEDLIMRPAFEQYLGEEGKAMSDHDREDHEGARNELLQLYAAFETLVPSDLTRLAVLRKRYAALMAELAEHMKTESGEDIPRLEAAMGRAESEELGRRYLKTMVVEPGLKIGGRRVWSDVGAYLNTGLQGLRRVWSAVVLEEQQQSSKL